MKVLFDTNVLLDALLAREPFVADAASLLQGVESGKIVGFVSATTVTYVYYLLEVHTKNAEIAAMAVVRLLALMDVCASIAQYWKERHQWGLPTLRMPFKLHPQLHQR